MNSSKKTRSNDAVGNLAISEMTDDQKRKHAEGSALIDAYAARYVSSIVLGEHPRVTPARAKLFLLELVNAQPKTAKQRVVDRFQEFFPQVPAPQELTDYLEWAFGLDHASDMQLSPRSDALMLAASLRAAWDAPDDRSRQWHVFTLRQTYHRFCGYTRVVPDLWEAISRRLPAVPPLTPMEQAMYFFVQSARGASHCENPTCPAPYFFAARSSQKFCSGPCSRPAQQAAKRQWWAENGTAWRVSRSKSAGRKPKASRN